MMPRKMGRSLTLEEYSAALQSGWFFEEDLRKLIHD